MEVKELATVSSQQTEFVDTRVGKPSLNLFGRRSLRLLPDYSIKRNLAGFAYDCGYQSVCTVLPKKIEGAPITQRSECLRSFMAAHWVFSFIL